MNRIWKHFTQPLLGMAALAMLPASAHAWEPSGGDLTRTVMAGDFTGYFANISVWLNKGTQTLRFSAPYQRGIAVRWFELKLK